MTLKIKSSTNRDLIDHANRCIRHCQRLQNSMKKGPFLKACEYVFLPSLITANASAAYACAVGGETPAVNVSFAAAMLGTASALPLLVFGTRNLFRSLEVDKYIKAIEYDQAILKHKADCRDVLKQYVDAKTPAEKKEQARLVRSVFTEHRALVNESIAFEAKHLRKKHQSFTTCVYAGRQRG